MKRSIPLATIALIALVGAIDAVRLDAWSTVAFFVTIAVLSIGTLLRRREHAVDVRGDHHAWLAQTASVTGETAEIVADRAIGAYRDVH